MDREQKLARRNYALLCAAATLAMTLFIVAAVMFIGE